MKGTLFCRVPFFYDFICVGVRLPEYYFLNTK